MSPFPNFVTAFLLLGGIGWLAWKAGRREAPALAGFGLLAARELLAGFGWIEDLGPWLAAAGTALLLAAVLARGLWEGVVAAPQVVDRRKEASSAELAEFLELVVDTAEVWVNTLDAEMRVVYWNRAAERISGYGHEDVAGRAEVWAWLYPDETYRTEIGTKAQAILRQGESFSDLETMIRTRSGASRIISWRSKALRDDQGRITGSMAVGRDVTDLREADARLTRVNAWQNLILEHNVLGMAYIRDRTILWANSKAARMLGHPLEAFVGASSRIIYPDDATYAAVGQRAYPILAEGGVFDDRLHLRRLDGQYFWCRLLGMAVDAGKPHEGSIWLAEDISRQVAVESALSESEARFRSVFEGTQDALLLLTMDGIFDCNQRALELFGFTHKSEMLRMHPADLSPARQPGGGDSRRLAIGYLQTARRQGGARFQWQHRSMTGETFPAEILLSSFRMGRQKVIQASIRDLRERGLPDVEP